MKALEALLRTFRRNDLFSDPSGRMLMIENPFTASPYVHLGGVERLSGNDEGEAWEGHGDLLKIWFLDEDGGQFVLHFAEHEGNVFYWVTNDAPAPKRRSKARAEEATAILQSVEHLSDDEPVF